MTLSLQTGFRNYNAFDEYHVKHNLSAMEKLFAGYVNAGLDSYLMMLEIS